MTTAPDIEKRVTAQLDGLGVPYEVVPIDPQYADTANFCARYGFPMEKSANTIIVASKKEPKKYAACVVQATSRLDVNHRVSNLLGAKRLSFADAVETVALTGMMIGGVTCLALPAGLPLYVDANLMKCDYVILGSGSRSSKIKVSPEVFRRVDGAQVVEGLVLAQAPQG
jgi:prolyl-tRNA editing enzyme YbaK/EbsC (Cys-tRNA(Pro) deacylase)